MRCAKLCRERPGGEQVALNQVTRVAVTRGPELINRESGQRRLVLMSNVRGRDLGGFVADVRSRINRSVNVPPARIIYPSRAASLRIRSAPPGA